MLIMDRLRKFIEFITFLNNVHIKISLAVSLTGKLYADITHLVMQSKEERFCENLVMQSLPSRLGDKYLSHLDTRNLVTDSFL